MCWIKNRFLRRPVVGGIPVYRVNVTSVLAADSPEGAGLLWNSKVLYPCLATLLGEKHGDSYPLIPEQFLEPSPYTSSDLPPPPYICAACNGRVFVNQSQWQEHLKSRTHKKRIANLKKNAI